MAIRFTLNQSQTQLLHAVSVGMVTATATYLADAFSRWAIGGPAVLIRSVILGATVAGVSKGLGIWVRSLTAP